jgi:hypothetical protein
VKEIDFMKRFAPLALTAAFMALGTSVASAQEGWSRSKTVTGPYGGVYSAQGSGSCEGNRCSSTQQRTGPAGNAVTRSGSTGCRGAWCRTTATYTGPNGDTATRARVYHRY